MKVHFKILNHKVYYNLRIDEQTIEAVRTEYRNRLSHNTLIGSTVAMQPGKEDSGVFDYMEGVLVLNLRPFLKV